MKGFVNRIQFQKVACKTDGWLWRKMCLKLGVGDFFSEFECRFEGEGVELRE